MRSRRRSEAIKSRKQLETPWLSASVIHSPVMPKSPLSLVAHCMATPLIAMAFSAPHLALWNSGVFALHAERVVWRVSTLGMMFIPLLEIPLLLLFHTRCANDVGWAGEKVDWESRERSRGRGSRAWVSACIWFLASLYCVCRVIAFVETFYSLHASPQDVYREVRWTGYLPHFS